MPQTFPVLLKTTSAQPSRKKTNKTRNTPRNLMNAKHKKHEENYTKVVRYNQINQTFDKKKNLKSSPRQKTCSIQRNKHKDYCYDNHEKQCILENTIFKELKKEKRNLLT